MTEIEQLRIVTDAALKMRDAFYVYLHKDPEIMFKVGIPMRKDANGNWQPIPEFQALQAAAFPAVGQDHA